ncbi:MAG: glycosyltransferase [Acidobacteriota bacterium]
MTGGQSRRRVLVAYPYSLHPMNHGGAVRIRNLMRRMLADFDVILFGFVGGSDDPEQRAALEAEGYRVVYQKIPEEDGVLHSGWPALPPDTLRLSSPRIVERLGALLDAHGVDVLLLECTEMGQYAGPWPRAASVLEEQDLAFRTLRRRRRLGFGDRYAEQKGTGDPEGEAVVRAYELAACRRSTRVHLMSEEDRRVLGEQSPGLAGKLRAVPNGVDLQQYRAPKGTPRRDLLFVGSFPHLPNLDALDWFLAEVWPLLRRRRPDMRLTVAGADPPQRVLDLDGADGVTVAGEVPDLRPFYHGHRALVVPVRAGSGTRLKILEAFAAELPVVSTSLGAEGLDVVDGTDLLLGDDPETLAAALERLWDDDQLARNLARRGRDLVERHYSWDAIYRGLKESFEEILPAPREDPGPIPPVEAPPAVGGMSAEGGEQDLDVTVIVVARRADDRLDRCLAALDRQACGRSRDILCAAPGVPEDRLEVLRRRGVSTLALPVELVEDLGRCLNRAASAARGRVLVLLDEDAEPIFDTWLDEITAPLFSERPPAAVAGRIQERFHLGSPQHRSGFTRESERWRSRFETDLTFRCAAVRRDTWGAWPFPVDVGPTDRAWQRMATEGELLILPLLSAVAWLDRPLTFGGYWRACVAEGEGWRRLGERYGTGDLWDDLRHPGRAFDPPLDLRELRRRPVASRAERLFPWLRPLGIFWGGLRARRRRDR